MRLTACWLVLAVFLAISPEAARAADAEARAHFERAEAAFRARRFEDARLGYQAAYEREALPGLLFNIAQCHRYLENHERAIFFYERYLELAGRTPDRARTLELIAQQRTLLKRKRAAVGGPREARTESGTEAAPAPAGTGTPARPGEAVARAPVVSTVPTVVSPPPVKLVAPSPVLSASPPAQARVYPAERRPLYRRWWFWTAAVVLVAGGVSAALLSRGDERLPEGPLGSIDRR
jgi:hypothetical protein